MLLYTRITVYGLNVFQCWTESSRCSID